VRPPFAREYPKVPEIDALLARFESGDYAGVREDAKKLSSHDDDDVRRAAADLVAHTEPDPAMRWLFLGVLAMILAVTGWWIARAH
jgi:hypothetical protein